jgi:hypothetical protein
VGWATGLLLTIGVLNSGGLILLTGGYHWQRITDGSASSRCMGC